MGLIGIRCRTSPPFTSIAATKVKMIRCVASCDYKSSIYKAREIFLLKKWRVVKSPQSKRDGRRRRSPQCVRGCVVRFFLFAKCHQLLNFPSLILTFLLRECHKFGDSKFGGQDLIALVRFITVLNGQKSIHPIGKFRK